MPFIQSLYNTNFLEYASYVIKDRAIPHVDDGLKPVQRRIMHTLFRADDGKFHKVANIVGECMKFHPHGDASIGDALVNLSNKDLFIDKQGNFGNIFTGDPAAAARYIECRLSPLARETMFNPEITEFVDSYDGRNQEPVTLPAKLPVLLALGAEGIAVGMSTKILPHNLIELLEAQTAYLRGEKFIVYPDFPTGGFADISEYGDGNGKVLLRAKLDTSDPKRIVIRELPFGSTTESIIASMETATRRGKLKIASINDFTAENVEIEIKLARGIHTQDTVDALYAFTDCESSVTVHMTVITTADGVDKPVVMTASQVVKHNSDRLVEILKAELKLEEQKLRDKLHAKTLEQIFIENRVYKKIEEKTTVETVVQAVLDGLEPFQSQIKREVTKDDVDTLLKIPIRRISLYDINRAKKEMKEIADRLKEIKKALGAIIDYTIDFLEKIIEKYRPHYPRRTELISFKKVDVREAAQRNLKLRYDKDTGYLGHEVNGNALFDVSPYDRILVIRKTGAYSVIDAPDKLFVDKGMLHCGLVDKDLVFSAIYRDEQTRFPYIKRFKVEQFILNKGYTLVPENCTLLRLTTDPEAAVTIEYKPKPRLKVLEESFNVKDFLVKGIKAGGVRLASKEMKSLRMS
ncbi:MAG: DNA topoisomerase IV subunit A [Chitinispirillales bacterium]|nr:DNA topoisomerase IV subunit A [Chitinispirillales bacterium]